MWKKGFGQISLWLMLLLWTTIGTAQSRRNIYSLLMVEKYLLRIDEAVTEKSTKKKQLEKLRQITLEASKTEHLLHRQLVFTKPSSEARVQQTKKTFHSVLQSLVLYQTDLKNNTPENQKEELHYLSQNIPAVIKNLYFFCQEYKTQIEENTH